MLRPERFVGSGPKERLLIPRSDLERLLRRDAAKNIAPTIVEQSPPRLHGEQKWPVQRDNPSQLDQALRKLNDEVLDGLRHGFFELTVRCETVSEHKRRFVIEAGKSYHYYIVPAELNR